MKKSSFAQISLAFWNFQNNAEVAVREMLKEMGQNAMSSTGISCLSAVDYMDDGSRINLKIRIDVNEGKAGNDSIQLSLTCK